MAITSINLGKIKFNWRGPWTLGADYVKDDVVRYNGSSYVCLVGHTSVTSWATNSIKFDLMAEGTTPTTTEGDLIVRGVSSDQRLGIGDPGQVLTVEDGNPVWKDNGVLDKIYYVAPTGDDTNSGQSWGTAFASIKYACTQAVGPATIYVASGQYAEELPITVPSFVAVVGDNQRTTIIGPAAGYEQTTMWKLGDGALLNKMCFIGLTGFIPYAPDDQNIPLATIGGVYVAFDAFSPILTKSPYVIECTAKSSGSVGAFLDGTVHASGYKSMVFHGYTVILDNGVGFWVKDNAKSEIVSCFTYFCHAGYVATGGGKIRALNGNNSYGEYGALATGYNLGEATLDGTLYGDQLIYASLGGGSFIVGNTITGGTSGATGTIVNVQASTNKIYYKSTNAFDFTVGETISNGSGVTATIDVDGVSGQKGFVLIVTGLTAEPRPGGSIEIAGDTFTYVIQTVSGWSSSASNTILVLSGEKASASLDGSAVTIRYDYSNIRLTGHDFLSIGTGGVVSTNYPGAPLQDSAQGNEVIEDFPARVFYVSTDQDGNFRVGEYFKVDQATGRATLNASAFDLSGLTSLRLGSIGAQLGELVNEFSADDTLSGNSNEAVPTEYAVKQYFSQISSNVVPSVTNLYTVGTSTRLYDKMYVNKVIGPAILILDPAAEGNDTGTVQIKGNLQVDGTTTTINSTTLTVDDKNIELASVASPTDTTADGAGITVKGATDKTFNWVDATDAWTSSEHLNIASTKAYYINDTSVLSATTLGSGVTGSSLTSVGTLTELTVTGTVNANGANGLVTSQIGTVGLFNTNATGLNIGGAATAVAIGAGTGTTTINNPTVTLGGATTVNINGANPSIVTTQTGTASVFNTNALTGNLFGAATSVTIGAVTGTATIRNATINLSNASGVLQINGTQVLSGTTLGSGVTGSSLTSVGTLTGLVVTNNQAAATNIDLFNNNSSGSGGIRVGFDATNHLRIFRNGNAADFYYNATQATANHYFQTAGSTTWTIGSTGNCVAAGTITSNSDAKLKTNVTTITGALDKVLALRGVMFDRISTGTHEMGTIAQEVEAVIPELVFTDENGIKSVAYANTVALLIEAIKEQQVQINELKGLR
jgi:hypothetical protein